MQNTALTNKWLHTTLMTTCLCYLRYNPVSLLGSFLRLQVVWWPTLMAQPSNLAT